MKKAFLLIAPLLVFFTFPGIYAASLEELVGAVNARALISGEKPVNVQSRNPKTQLVPRHQSSKDIIETMLRDHEGSTLVETLHLYEKPSSAQKEAWSANEESRLYNNLLALSTLAGLQYFSASRGVMRTFYESSSVIDDPSAMNPLPDPVFPYPRTKQTVYARQHDLTFGDNVYQYDYYSVPGGMIFIQQNLTPLKIGIITAIARNNLRSAVTVLDAEKYVLVYAVSVAKTISVPGMKDRVGNSFSNRAEAILNWFKAQADKAFGN